MMKRIHHDMQLIESILWCGMKTMTQPILAIAPSYRNGSLFSLYPWALRLCTHTCCHYTGGFANSERRTCASSIYAMTYGQITKEFDCSQEIAILGLSLFVLGLAVGPLVMSPLSEVGCGGRDLTATRLLTSDSSTDDGPYIWYPYSSS